MKNHQLIDYLKNRVFSYKNDKSHEICYEKYGETIKSQQVIKQYPFQSNQSNHITLLKITEKKTQNKQKEKSLPRKKNYKITTLDAFGHKARRFKYEHAEPRPRRPFNFSVIVFIFKTRKSGRFIITAARFLCTVMGANLPPTPRDE